MHSCSIVIGHKTRPSVATSSRTNYSAPLPSCHGGDRLKEIQRLWGSTFNRRQDVCLDRLLTLRISGRLSCSDRDVIPAVPQLVSGLQPQLQDTDASCPVVDGGAIDAEAGFVDESDRQNAVLAECDKQLARECLEEVAQPCQRSEAVRRRRGRQEARGGGPESQRVFG